MSLGVKGFGVFPSFFFVRYLFSLFDEFCERLKILGRSLGGRDCRSIGEP